MLAYVAGPIDRANAGQLTQLEHDRYSIKDALHERGFATFDPILPYGNPRGDSAKVVAVNTEALLLADVVVALLPAGVPTVGTPMEVYQAHSLGKPAVCIGATESMQLDGLGIQTVEWGEWEQAADVAKVKAATDPYRTPVGQTGMLERIVGSHSQLKYVLTQDGCDPRTGYPGDAGVDLYVSENTRIPFGQFADVPCGCNVELPPGTWGMLTGRSSTIRDRGLFVTQGIIDNGYRGPLFAGVHNLSDTSVQLQKGDRIAQLIVLPLVPVAPQQVDALSQSDRGSNGFGSSGR